MIPEPTDLCDSLPDTEVEEQLSLPLSSIEDDKIKNEIEDLLYRSESIEQVNSDLEFEFEIGFLSLEELECIIN